MVLKELINSWMDRNIIEPFLIKIMKLTLKLRCVECAKHPKLVLRSLKLIYIDLLLY